MPIIHIYAKNNKTIAMKRRTVRGITDVFMAECGVPAEVVQIFWHDVDDHNYGRAGVLLSDRPNVKSSKKPPAVKSKRQSVKRK